MFEPDIVIAVEWHLVISRCIDERVGIVGMNGVDESSCCNRVRVFIRRTIVTWSSYFKSYMLCESGDDVEVGIGRTAD